MHRSLLALGTAMLLCLFSLTLPEKPALALSGTPCDRLVTQTVLAERLQSGESLDAPLDPDDLTRWWTLLYPPLTQGEEGESRYFSWLARLFGHELTIEGGRWTWK